MPLIVTLSLGVSICLGVVLGAGQAQAAPVAAGAATTPQALVARPGAVGFVANCVVPWYTPPANHGPCGGNLKVTSVNGWTITVTRPDGSTATVHVASYTHVVLYGHRVAASTVWVGSRIFVVGNCSNHRTHIWASRIVIIG
jgi:hypothetical protein